MNTKALEELVRARDEALNAETSVTAVFGSGDIFEQIAGRIDDIACLLIYGEPTDEDLKEYLEIVMDGTVSPGVRAIQLFCLYQAAEDRRRKAEKDDRVTMPEPHFFSAEELLSMMKTPGAYSYRGGAYSWRKGERR